MTSVDPQPPMPPLEERQVPMLISPVPQGWRCDEGDVGGQKVAVLTILSPFNTAMITLNEESALQLADSLRSKFSGLAIATEIPRPGSGSPLTGVVQ